METTKNQMSPYAKNFFHKLKNYLDTNIYYFGSIQRNDYFQNYSDIDVDIFTDNEHSIISKLQNFLGVNRYEFKKFVYKLHIANKVVYGYKIAYKEPINNFFIEISIYNENDKKYVLNEHNSKVILPFYISFFLIILKTFYYQIGIIPKNIYVYIKQILMNYMVEGTDVEFVTTEIPKHKDEKK